MEKESALSVILKVVLYVILLPIFLIIWIWDKSGWQKRNKWIATAGIGVFLLIALSSYGNSENPAQQAKKLDEIPKVELQPIPAETTKLAEEQPQDELQQAAQNSNETGDQVIKVAHVVDGDTIKLENGQVVRYIGIDTPETVDPRKPVQCFGKEASAKNKELIEGKEVKLVKDISETDKYDRLLRYVYIGDTFVNDYLVRNGFAKSSTYPPDVKYQDQFKRAEEEARSNKRGLWADDACKTETVPTSATTPTAPTNNASGSSNSGSAGAFTCNCSKTCPQMGCAEAQYQLNTCGCTRRDADHDGIACDADCQ